MKKFIPVFLIIITSSFVLRAQDVTGTYIDSLVDAAMKGSAHAGIAVAVVKDGKVIHSKGYGLRNANTGEKVDEHTLFSIASNSKAFTTMAIGMLAEEGKLSWDDKVVQYIPEFTMYDSYVQAHFTIRDLVTHRSGLGLGAGDLMFIPDGADFTVDDILRSFQYQKPVSEFRTKYDYDNLLYIVAGEVIHRVSGLSWDAFVEQRIMKPLGMLRSAGYRENLTSANNVAVPHGTEGGKVRVLNPYEDPHKLFGPAGGIYASVEDLTKWMLCHLNGGTLGDVQLISEKGHDELWHLETMIRYSATGAGRYNSHYEGYGLGWELTEENGYTIVSHTGGMPGMLSHTMLIPELNAGIVVLTNAAPGGLSFYSLPNAIKDRFIGMEDIDWIGRVQTWASADEADSDTFVEEVWKTVAAAKKTQPDWSLLTGSYQDNWFGKINIENRNGKLWFSSERSPRLNGELFFYKANSYVAKWEYREMNCDAFVSFTLDENGKATEILMKGLAPNIDFSFDFHDLHFHRLEE